MLYAIINDAKVEATPSSRATCPFCKLEMIAKCGSIKTWHWAHKQKNVCDTWKSQETEWHRNWKSVFGKENTEIIIFQNGQKHIADIQTKAGRVIELQNSPISSDTIEVRENFYAPNMIWIINGKKFEQTFIIKALDNQMYDDYSSNFEYFAKLHDFTPKYKPTPGSKQELQFQWCRPHESWQQSKCEIYIDFGYDNLFCVIHGIGSNKGRGYEIPKLDFLKLHGGNESLLSKIVRNSNNN